LYLRFDLMGAWLSSHFVCMFLFAKPGARVGQEIGRHYIIK
jgi:hypothetical protein